VDCPACAAENRAGAKFCNECGTPLAQRCPSCGAPYAAGQRFCDECGAALSAPAPSSEPVAAELRVVSVLFVDLVGYTSLSESRDAEAVRELLSRYFETARTIVGRYGGTIEKFIGDAVMAVWGTPLAREDDAERAVRAALELVDAVTAFGQDVGAPQLRARAGVVTGQVASATSPGEGLVVGDRVNTAARVQSTAEPGTVYADAVTRQASSAAIAYADAGEHTVKGKAEPLRLWRALRVVAGARGAQAEQGLAAPFLGREAELRVLKDAFHAAIDRNQPRLITVLGAPGVGKSRMRMEFFRYIDGLADTILWHSGRCLSYGDGVAYWALAEMVRQRLGIEEDAPPDVAESKLVLGLERWLPDRADQAFVAERVRGLIGLSEPALSRAELFAGWRLLFERLAEQSPVVLAFEDVQWADDGLPDFIDHLLDWASAPIVVLAFARSELGEREPTWVGGRAGVTPIFLEPLPDAVIGELLDSLVGGLPGPVRERIVAQAEGMALYALETVRALLDQGLLGEEGGRLVVRGDIGQDLAVPASLTSLLTARLDALEPDERALVKDLAVMGGSFPRSTVDAVCSLPPERLDALLAALVRKQVLAVRADPLSPDSGQYVFGQTLLRSVAYDMLSRRERKPRHLAIAAHLRSTSGDSDELAEVIAAHMLDAYRAAAGDPDEDELRADALAALRRGAQRAAAIGAPESAERTSCSAAELAGDPVERAGLVRTAGDMAALAGELERALAHYETAAAALETAGEHRQALGLVARMCRVLTALGRNSEGAERAHVALEQLGPDARGPEIAEILLERGYALLHSGAAAEADPLLQRALELAQAYELPAVTVGALNRRAILCARSSRIEEARILFTGAADVGSRHGMEPEQARALLNRGDLLWRYDLDGAEASCRDALALAQRMGDRGNEGLAGANLAGVLLSAGRWDEADALCKQLLAEGGPARREHETMHFRMLTVAGLRGDVAAAREHLAGMESWRGTEDAEAREMLAAAELSVALAAEATPDAAAAAIALLASLESGPASEAARHLLPPLVEAIGRLGLRDQATGLLRIYEDVPPGHMPPSARAYLALLGGGEAADAVATFAAIGQPYGLAMARVAQARRLLEQGRDQDAALLLEQAATTFQDLRAASALDRVLRLRDEQPQDAVSA
jgi:class 3 adenylate cyclase/tetratricopeptide (TPR) repeat protein